MTESVQQTTIKIGGPTTLVPPPPLTCCWATSGQLAAISAEKHRGRAERAGSPTAHAPCRPLTAHPSVWVRGPVRCRCAEVGTGSVRVGCTIQFLAAIIFPSCDLCFLSTNTVFCKTELSSEQNRPSDTRIARTECVSQISK